MSYHYASVIGFIAGYIIAGLLFLWMMKKLYTKIALWFLAKKQKAKT